MREWIGPGRKRIGKRNNSVLTTRKSRKVDKMTASTQNDWKGKHLHVLNIVCENEFYIYFYAVKRFSENCPIIMVLTIDEVAFNLRLFRTLPSRQWKQHEEHATSNVKSCPNPTPDTGNCTLDNNLSVDCLMTWSHTGNSWSNLIAFTKVNILLVSITDDQHHVVFIRQFTIS